MTSWLAKPCTKIIMYVNYYTFKVT